MRLTLRKLVTGGTAFGVTAALIALSLAWRHEIADAATTTVNIQNFAFSPSPKTISVGDTVVFQNNDAGIPHTATSDAGVSPTFDTGNIAGGSSASITFTTAGTFAFHCNIHPSMHGTIVVQQATASSTATTPASTATPASTTTTPAPTATTAPTQPAPTATTAPAQCLLTVADQSSPANATEVVVATSRVPRAGYVVIHEAGPTGGPGPVIGNISISPNVNVTNAKVPVSRALKNGESVWAMLHTEDNGNGVYDDAATDKPIVSTVCGNPSVGNVATFPIKVTFAVGPPATGTALAGGNGSGGASTWMYLLGIGVAASVVAAAGAVAVSRRRR